MSELIPRQSDVSSCERRQNRSLYSMTVGTGTYLKQIPIFQTKWLKNKGLTTT